MYYDFLNLGLYFDFDIDPKELRSKLKSFLKEYDIDLSQVKVIYAYPDLIECQNNGFTDRIPTQKYLETLTDNQCNMYVKDDNTYYINMFNNLTTQPSIAVFIGELTDELNEELNQYKSYYRTPYYTIA